MASMRQVIAAVGGFVASLLIGHSVLAQPIYASTDGKPGFYYDEQAQAFVYVAEPRRLEAALREISGTEEKPRAFNEQIIVQLLVQSDAERKPVTGAPTRYRSIEPGCHYMIEHVHADSRPLVIQGVRYQGRWLTEFSGPSVADVIRKKHACKAGGLAPAIAAAVAPATPVGTEGEDPTVDRLLFAEAQRAAVMRVEGSIESTGEQGSLVRCMNVDASSGITFSDLAFRDCWLPGIFLIDSANITVKNSLFVGSSYAVIAVASGLPEAVHDFTIENNVWIADDSGYGTAANAGKEDCGSVYIDPAAADCPGVVWSSVPWGVSHDTFYEHMNGALFGSIDSAGRVTFRGNIIRNAFNGIRMTASKACGQESTAEKKDCLTKINKDVVIAGNRFAFVRDNPIEPERRAVNWRIYDNAFFNSHGWISTDGVAGGPIYIWGNTGWFNDVPARACNDAYHDPTWRPGWTWRSPQHVDFVHGGYQKIRQPEPPFAYTCAASLLGTVLKVGDEKPELGKQVYLFHNSWYIKSPIVRGGSTGTIHHWDNAIELVGCGASPEANPLCRIYPTTEEELSNPEECKGFADFWTRSEQSLFAKCIPERELRNAKQYDFHHDVVSQGFPPCCLPAESHEEIAPGFRDGVSGDFRTVTDATHGRGCVVKPVVAGGRLTGLECEGTGADVGKFDRNGNPYVPPPELLKMP
ncbi:MAG TPA: right-handed parallel beta-helix repeat-containing protein [Dongiaceae bacterium]